MYREELSYFDHFIRPTSDKKKYMCKARHTFVEKKIEQLGTTGRLLAFESKSRATQCRFITYSVEFPP